MYLKIKFLIMTKPTVKARERYGTNSLDLTLPSEIKKKYSINKGDLFKVEVKNEDNELKLVYTLIYKNE